MRLSPSVAILRTQSDDRLVELARGGSEAAFAAIVERYRREMLRGCRRVLAESRAEDAVQQAFISAWRALERGDAVADLRAWLMRIARNTALNALRVPGYEYDELRESLRGSEAPQGELERRDVVRQTLAGLAALPERQRDALIRSAVEGASHAEIAKALGLSEGATRQLVMRARATMRSAATALTPVPLIAWAGSSGRGEAGGEFATRIAELAAGAGAGGGALLAKASVVTVVAGSVLAGPAVVKHEPERAKADQPRAAASAKPRTSAVFKAVAHDAATANTAKSGAGSARSGPSGGSAKGSSSGSGTGKSGSDDDKSGSSGSGKHDVDEPDAPEADTPETDSSGPGSGSSGSDSSGSGSSGSGSSGSGSSGHGSGKPDESEPPETDRHVDD